MNNMSKNLWSLSSSQYQIHVPASPEHDTIIRTPSSNVFTGGEEGYIRFIHDQALQYVGQANFSPNFLSVITSKSVSAASGNATLFTLSLDVTNPEYDVIAAFTINQDLVLYYNDELYMNAYTNKLSQKSIGGKYDPKHGLDSYPYIIVESDQTVTNNVDVKHKLVTTNFISKAFYNKLEGNVGYIIIAAFKLN
jgi:hypothetical protein